MHDPGFVICKGQDGWMLLLILVDIMSMTVQSVADIDPQVVPRATYFWWTSSHAGHNKVLGVLVLTRSVCVPYCY